MSAVLAQAPDASRFILETSDEYYSKSKQYITATRVKSYLRRESYWRWRTRTLQLEQANRHYSESDGTLFGKAFHVLALQGATEYRRRFVVGGPINRKSKSYYTCRSKRFQEWEVTAERQGILAGRRGLPWIQHDLCKQLARAVRSNSRASKLLADGIAEGILRGRYCGVQCQICLDWFSPRYGVVELKTCLNLSRFFKAQCQQYDYLTQLAFNQAVFVASLYDEDVASVDRSCFPPIYLIAVERMKPHNVGITIFNRDDLYRQRLQVEYAVRELGKLGLNDWWQM